MKRTLIAASLALLSAGAFAQSSVQVYGRVNVTVESVKLNGGSRTIDMIDNASRVGFRGVEDLGGGMKGLFTLEHGFNVNSGTPASSTVWNRESTVGLSGGFGKVLLGNQAANAAYFAITDYVSMHNHDTGPSSDDLSLFGYTSLKNSVGYFSPDMGGFNFAVQTAEGKDYNGYKRPLVLAANYDAGALHLGFGYAKSRLGATTFDPTMPAGLWADTKAFGVRALYEFGALTLGGFYERDKANDGFGDASSNLVRLAAMYTVGASEFHVNVGKRTGDWDGKQWTLAYNYNLSKRTKVYTYYTDAKDTISWTKRNSFAVGVRHNF